MSVKIEITKTQEIVNDNIQPEVFRVSLRNNDEFGFGQSMYLSREASEELIKRLREKLDSK